MKIELRYFASVREAFGCASETLETDACTLGALREVLMARPGAGAAALARGRAVRMAVNQVMCDESSLLNEGCEVAFFPPVTGG